VLFYLTAYALANAGAFAVLMLLPARHARPGSSAETMEDLAGQGRHHVGLGLAMTVACFSLIGLPLTVGFLGKLMLIKPMLTASPISRALPVGHTQLIWLAVIMVVNAAISAGYYLRIVGTMFLRPAPEDETGAAPMPALVMPFAVVLALTLSIFGTLLLGAVPPATEVLINQAGKGSELDHYRPALPTPASISAEQ
jgi:NADH-quinone oxidoreductase subunit N